MDLEERERWWREREARGEEEESEVEGRKGLFLRRENNNKMKRERARSNNFKGVNWKAIVLDQ
jgi:hypothetical protein